MKTAWFLTHRIREIMKRPNDGLSSPAGGEGQTIEADLTFVGRKPGTKVRRGKKAMPRTDEVHVHNDFKAG